MHSLIIGCGDTGVRVAARCVAAGDRVTGVVRSDASAARVRAVGAQARLLDLDDDVLDLPACERLFYFAPPARAGDTDTRMQRVLAHLDSVPEYVVYISTSGVYGDCGGGWVDESYPLAPETDRARRRVDAETQLRAWCEHAVVLRAPGIYGPGRLPVERVHAATPILRDADAGWTNRIHVDDLAGIAYLAGQHHWPSNAYNASDGRPTRMSAYYDALAELLGVAPPPQVDWAVAEREFSAMRLSFLRESRRLSNDRLCREMGYRFVFADFRSGLEASLKAEP